MELLQQNNGIVNNTVNNNTINNYNAPVNITVNHYLQPNCDYIDSIFPELVKQFGADTPAALVIPIWFNKEHPENHSIYLVNKKTREVLVYDHGGWAVGDIDSVLVNMHCKIVNISIDQTIECDNLQDWLDTWRRERENSPIGKKGDDLINKLSLGSSYIGKPMIEKLAPTATITNTKIINAKCYMYLDRKTLISYALINPRRYKKIKRKWVDNDEKILDLTNEDLHEFTIVEQEELNILSKSTVVYDISRGDIRTL